MVVGWAGATQRISGDAQDGIYQATMTVPAFSEQGTWTVDIVGLRDNAGNHTYIQTPASSHPTAAYPTSLSQEVRGVPAVPDLRSLALSPGSVDTSAAQQ